MRPSHHRGPLFFGLSLTLALLLSLGATTLGLLSAGAAPLAAPITPPTISGFIGAANGLQVDDLDNNPQTAPNANVTTGGITDLDCVNPSPAGEVDSNCPQVAGATAYLDWNTLPGAGTAGKYVINDKTPDDSFGGTGTTSCLQPDHSAPPKEDIQRLYLANNNEFLYFGLVDASPNGDSRHIILFHKNPIDSGATCAGNGNLLSLDLTNQDRMILALFHPSASEPAARVFQVVGNPANQLIDPASDFTNAAVWAPSATATNFAVNTTAIPNDVLGGGGSLVADTFGEGAIPMSALGINACSGGKFFVTVITRSSGSGGGTAKDFIAGAYQFSSISVTASLTPSCSLQFGYAAQAFDTGNNPVPDANANYDWTCTGGVDPQGKSGTQAAAAGSYTCTVTANLVDNPTCTATSDQQVVNVFAPLNVSIAPNATGLACPLVDTAGTDVTYTATPSGGNGAYTVTWAVTGENAAPVCGPGTSCLVDSAATNYCAVITVNAHVADTSGLCPAVDSETETVTKQTTVSATNN